VTYIVDESGRERVPGIKPERAWTYWRARAKRDKLNAERLFPSYRWEVVKEGRRWLVVAFQNYARSVP
jgi:hypothetical protein